MKSIINIAKLPTNLKRQILNGLNNGSLTIPQALRTINRHNERRAAKSSIFTKTRKPVSEPRGFNEGGGHSVG